MGDEAVTALIARVFSPGALDGKRLLLIVPDHTRTAPVGRLFKAAN